jgi:hypothetical protein
MAWVVGQGTNQLIQPGWSSFRYAVGLGIALGLAIAALLVRNSTPPANQTVSLTIGVVAGLEVCVFGFVWLGLVVGLPSP